MIFILISFAVNDGVMSLAQWSTLGVFPCDLDCSDLHLTFADIMFSSSVCWSGIYHFIFRDYLPTGLSLLFSSSYKSPASCELIPGSVSVSRLCCPKAVWVPVRKRRAKATLIQTSFPDPLQQRLHCGAMSNPSAPNQITDAVAAVIHSVSPHARTQRGLGPSCHVRPPRGVGMLNHMT